MMGRGEAGSKGREGDSEEGLHQGLHSAWPNQGLHQYSSLGRHVLEQPLSKHFSL